MTDYDLTHSVKTWVFFSAEETQTDDQHRFTIETITLVLPKVDF